MFAVKHFMSRFKTVVFWGNWREMEWRLFLHLLTFIAVYVVIAISTKGALLPLLALSLHLLAVAVFTTGNLYYFQRLRRLVEQLRSGDVDDAFKDESEKLGATPSFRLPHGECRTSRPGQEHELHRSGEGSQSD